MSQPQQPSLYDLQRVMSAMQSQRNQSADAHALAEASAAALRVDLVKAQECIAELEKAVVDLNTKLAAAEAQLAELPKKKTRAAR